MILPRLQLASLYILHGRRDEAQTLIRESLRVNPELTADIAVNFGLISISLDPDQKTELRARLRRAGLP